ncbi:hypothetical protein COB55_04680, partial [Candidatus Wolfebacteria bacterium]
ATTETTIESAIDTLGNLTSASALATVGTITSGVWSGTALVDAKVDNDITIDSSTVVTAPNFVGDTNTASTFPYASTTAITATTASTTNLYVSGLTSGRVPYLTTGGLFTDSSNLIFDGTKLTSRSLEVYSSSGNTSALVHSDAGHSILSIDSSSGTGFDPKILFKGDGSTQWNIGVDTSDSNKLFFGTNEVIQTTPLVTFLTTGSVGIGTTSPYAKLSVVGEIVGETITATSTGFRAPAGSVSVPSYGFTSTSGLGIYDGGSNQMGFTVASVNRMLIDNVRVTLAGSGANAANPRLGLNGNTTGIYTTGSNHLGITLSQDAQQEWTSGVSQFSIGSANSTSYALNVRKARGSVTTPTVITTGDDLLTISGYGHVGASNTYQEAAQILFDSTGTIADSTTGIGGIIRFSTADVGSEPLERLTILNDGNVGIGTTTPGYKLSVEGTAYFADTLIASAITSTSTVTGANFVASSASATSTFAGGFAVETSGFVYDFSTNNVGIGTASPDNTLDISGTFEVTKEVIGTWSQTGNGLSRSNTAPTITSLSSTRIAYLGEFSDKNLRTFDFDGTDWAQVGNALSITDSSNTVRVTGLSANRVAYMDGTNDQLRTYDFDGTDWAQVGNGLGITSNFPSIATLTSSRIAFIDDTDDNLRAYDFDGTDWAQVGNGLSLTSFTTPAMTGLSSSRIAFIDRTNDTLRTYDFDGTDWAQVGNGLAISSVEFLYITTLSSSRIAFLDSGNDDLRVYEFDGSDWSEIGTELNISGVGYSPALAALSSTRVAFIDGSNDNLRTYDLDVTNPNFLFDSSGNVAIGTTTPNNKLDIYSTTKSAIGFSGASGSTYKWTIGMDVTNAGRFAIASSTALGTTDRFVIDGAGNVGIGSTTPWALLAVNPNGITGPSFAIGSSTQTDFIVTNAGNVGIGTASPSESLVVNGSGSITTRVKTTASNTYSRLNLQADDGSGGQGNLYQFGTTYGTSNLFEQSSTMLQGSGTGGLILLANDASTKGIRFATGGTANSNERMRLDSSGNLGIGTTTPYAKLSVVGEIVGETITATSTGFRAPLGSVGAPSYSFSADTDTGLFSAGVGNINLSVGGSNVLLSGGTQVAVVVGTASQPGLTDITTANSGLYWPSAGQLGISAGGAEAIRIDASQRVGIGTTSPPYRLSVAGFINTDQYSGFKQAGVTILYASSTNNTLFVGANAGDANTTGARNVGVGTDSLGAIVSANDSTAIGYNSLLLDTGGNNTAVGSYAGDAITSGVQNVAMGVDALGANQGAANNVAIGFNASLLTTGADNTSLGSFALDANTSGTNNVAIGYDALGANNTNSGSVAVGRGALNLSTGATNIAIGDLAGDNITSGSSNLIIGYNIDAPSATLSNQLNIGNLIFGTGIDGTGLNISSGNIGIGTSTPFGKLSIQATSGDQTTNLFIIASSSQKNFLQIDARGGITQSIAADPVTVGNWDPNDTNIMQGAFDVHVSGKYAYVTGNTSRNMAIIDISDPSNPVTEGNWDPNDTNIMNYAADVYVAGKYAYIAGSNSDGMVIVDISDPTNPTTTGHWDPNDTNIIDNPQGIYVSGKYAYLAGVNSDNMAIVDISDPTNPVLAGNWKPNDTNIMDYATDVYVVGKYAYVSGYSSNNLAIIDISDPANPITAGNWDPNDTNIMQSAEGVYVSGKYAYVAGFASSNLAIVDISDPSNPTTAGNFDPNDTSNILFRADSVYVSGKYAYIAGNDTDNMLVVDISSSTNPILVGNWKPNDTNVIQDTLSVYVSGKYLYAVGNTSDNMAIIDIGGLDVPSAHIGDLAVGTLDVWENLDVANDLSIAGSFSAGGGRVDGVMSIGGYASTTASFTNTTPSLSINIKDSGTNTIIDALSISRSTTGTAANNIGVGLLFQTEFNSTGGAVSTATSTARIASLLTEVATSTGITSDLAFYVKTGNGALTEKLRLTSSGNVGIGTTSPWGLLSINPNGITGPSFAIGSSTQTDFIVTNAGNVGIGTDGPTELVELSQSSGAHLRITSSDTAITGIGTELGGLEFFTADSSGSGPGIAASIRAINLGTAGGQSGLKFSTQSASATDVEHMRIDNLGNVGIGTTSPPYKLSVAGFINTDQYSGFKQAGVTILHASSTNQGIFVGGGAGASILAGGTKNVGVGYNAGTALTTGDENVLVGYLAGDAMTTGIRAVGIGSNALGVNTADGNVAVGYYSLASNISSEGNTAVGYLSLNANTASNNTAFGFAAVDANVSGTRNTGLGYSALSAIQTTNDSTAIGYNALLLDVGGSNTAVGSLSLDANTSGTQNVALGYGALGTNITNGSNTAIGYNALTLSNGGYSNTAVGSYALDANTLGAWNVGVGVNALGANTTGSSTVAIGYNALGANTTGASSTAIGYQALFSNTTSDDNTAVGAGALFANTTGQRNTALGLSAGGAITDGDDHVAIGWLAGDAVTSNNRTVFVGSEAGTTNTADDIVGIGHHALRLNSSGARNTALGSYALSTIATANDSTAFGFNALILDTGGSNTAVGSYAGDAIVGGVRNVAIGLSALTTDSSSNDNVGIGYEALKDTTGGQNTAVGSSALNDSGSGNSNTAIGYSALTTNTNSSGSTAVGHSALIISTGAGNIAFGYKAGDNITSGANNLIIGYDIDAASTTASYQLNIGNLLFSRGIDGTGTTLSSGNLGIGTSTPYRKLEVYSTAGSQLRLSHFASTTYSNYVDLGITNNGRFSISLENQPNRLSINELGNVGIGATALTPSYTLDVSGTFRAGDIRSTTGGTFAADVVYGAGSSPSSVSVGDLNNDGYTDVVTGNGNTTVSVLLNDGDGTFAADVLYTTGSTAWGTAIGDFNNDGYADIVSANYGTANVSVLINDGDGTFATKADYGAGTNPIGVTIGDFNNDGYMDIVTGNSGSTNISVLINDGDGTFAADVLYTSGAGPYFIDVGDFDNDGFADIAVVNYTDSDISVFINDGDGTFAAKVDYATGVAPYNVTIDDFDNDGYVDIAVTNETDYDVSVFINDGDGTFAAKVDYATNGSSFGPRGLGSYDVNNDGYIDMVTANQGNNDISVFINDGDGTFASEVGYGAGTSPQGVAMGDFNNDGYVDIVTNNYGSSDISVFLNSPSTFFYAQSSNSRIGIGTSTPWAQLAVNPNGISGPSFAIGSSTKTDFIVTNSGNVGIGTTTPGTLLSIAGNAYISGSVIFADGSTQNTAAGSAVWASSGGYTTLSTIGNSVGIGTSTPFARLAIQAADGDQTTNLFVIASSSQKNFLQIDARGGITQSIAADPVTSGNWDPNDTNVMDGAREIYISGKYAYVVGASSNNMAIVDISNPVIPTTVGNWDPNDTNIMNSATAVYVSSKYGYVTGQTSDNMAIVDVSNPSSPVTIGNWDPNDTNVMQDPQDVYVSGKYAYVVGETSDNMAIVDISDPINPITVGNWDPNDSNIMDSAFGVYISGKYAYVLGASSKNIAIVDISDPANPITIGNWDPNDNNVMLTSKRLYVSGKYAYAVGSDSHNLVIVNISDPSNPVLAANWDPNDTNIMSIPSEVYVSGKYAYVAGSGSDNLAVIDISSSTNPILVANWQPADTNVMEYPTSVFVSGKYAYVAGQVSNNLAIIDIGGFDAPSAHIGDLAVGTLDVWENADIANNLYVGNGLNVGVGGLYSQGGIFSYVASSTATTPVSASFMGGNVGIGTTTPYAELSVVGQVVANYFTATSTTATSTFANGIQLTNGCFYYDGACLTPGASVAGSTGQIQFNNAGSLSATSNLYWDNTNNRLGINTAAPTAALSVSASSTAQSITKSSTSDFSISGSTNIAGVSTTTGQIMLNFATTTDGSVGLGTFTAGPALVGTAAHLAQAGAHSLQRPDGKILIILGNSTSNTSIYDPVANTFVAGPAIVGTAAHTADFGAYSFQRPDGKFFVILANATTNTSIYDPVANTFVAGPALASGPQLGSHAIQRPDGKFLIVIGNSGSATEIYDPINNTLVTGPTVVGTAGNNVYTGSHFMQRPDGKFLLVQGGGTSNTSIYDPVANTFIAGPAVVGTAANLVENGGHAIQRPDGKYLVILANNTSNTSIYDPIANVFIAGPAVVGTAGNLARQGANSIQRPDGKFLLILGGETASSNTSIYDPVANTFSAGPAIIGTAAHTLRYGGHSIQRPDGKYLIILGNNTSNTSIYDPGLVTIGSYESEAMEMLQLSQSSVLKWNDNGEGIIEMAVKTATSEGGLSSATYATTTNGGYVYPTDTATWAQVRVTMTRPIPTNNQPYNRRVNSNVWLGSSDTKYYREFAQPAVYDFTIDNSAVFRKSNADFGTGFATSTASGSAATSTVPVLSNLIGGSKGGITLPYGFNSASTTATSTLIGNNFASSTDLVGTAANLARYGAHSLQRPDGKFLIVLGNSSSNTSIYDPHASTSAAAFIAGPALSASAHEGGHSIQRPDGKFLVVHGGGVANTSIYDPVSNTAVAGPVTVGTSASQVYGGAHSIQRPDGKFLVILANLTAGNESSTSIYDPVANTFVPGPNIVGTSANDPSYGSHSIQRPDGKYLVILANSTSDTSIYDPVANTFVPGPSVVGTAANLALDGSHSIQRPDGKFLVILGKGTSDTSIYDPVADTFTAGPAIVGTAANLANNGSHSVQRPDGKFLVILGNNASNTSIYDPLANIFTAGPILNSNLISMGAHSIQLPNGRYLVISGNTTAATNLYDAGFTTSGSYVSETIYNANLTSESALAWTGNADAFKPGAVSFRVKTATSQAGLATTTWRTLPNSGSAINPGDGDDWMQVQIRMNRDIPRQHGAQRNVWLGESSVVYNRFPLDNGAENLAETFTKPEITSYKVINVDNSDLATFTLNGQSLFRFSASGEAFTGGGAWNAGGADVAEYFPTDDFELVPGDIVSVSPWDSSGLVSRSYGSYDEHIIGIVSTNPGLKLGSDVTGGNAGKKPIALTGRVPVRVSLEGGPIAKGDRLTTSNVRGVAMKSTEAGRVVGFALEDYTLQDEADGVRSVLVFVGPHEWSGPGGFFSREGKRLTQWNDVVSDTLADFAFYINDGHMGLGTTTSAVFTIANTIASTTPVMVVRGIEGQVADLFRIEGSDEYALFSVNAEGRVNISAAASSTAQLTVTGATSTLAFLDTSNIGWNIESTNGTLSFNTLINEELASSTTSTVASTTLTLLANGNVGIGTTSPEHPLVMKSGAHVTKGGAWTNASSRELKENFTELDNADILGKILALEITQWNYKGEHASTTHIGPVAEDFQTLFALGGSNTSISTIDPAGIALIGIQALNERIDALDIEGILSDENNSIFDAFIAYLDGLGTRIVAGIVYVTNLVADRLVTEELCVGDTCITESELKELLSSADIEGIENTFTDEWIDTTIPTLTLNGNNPAVIPLNSTYNDLGANVEDDTSDNLGYKTYVDGVYTTNISLDTSTSTTYIISYSATDQDGNTSTTTRSVVVGTGGGDVVIAEETETTTPGVVIQDSVEEATQEDGNPPAGGATSKPEVVIEDAVEEDVTLGDGPVATTTPELVIEETVEDNNPPAGGATSTPDVVVEETPTEEIAVEESVEEIIVEETPAEEEAEEIVAEETPTTEEEIAIENETEEVVIEEIIEENIS